MANGDQSYAGGVYEEIVAAPDPVAYVREMVSAKVEETEWLDFKTDGGGPKKTKQTWSKALSGFANTQGGVLIWGVVARKTSVTLPNGDTVELDVAQKLELVQNPLELKTQLNNCLRQAVEGPLPGVEIDCFPSTGDRGVVVCFVPQGTSKPYRANLVNDGQYFMRIRDSFHVIPHPFLRDLFYPRTAPSLTVTLRPIPSESSGLDGGTLNLAFILFISNSGTRTARDLVVQ